MTKLNTILSAGLLTLCSGLQSCDTCDNDGIYLWQPTALVTVCPQSDESVLFQLDDETTLNPVNIKKSPYGKKEVRALVNYTPVKENDANTASPIVDVHVHWVDSIRTKMPVSITNPEDYADFANDPVEIVKDWVTVAEDGYLTLRVRTFWSPGHKHSIDLLYDASAATPLTFELRHNAEGDFNIDMGDALVAFNLNEVIADMPQPVTITLKWNSFSGEKSTKFSLNGRKAAIQDNASKPTYSNLIN